MKRASKYLKLYQQLKLDIANGNYPYEEPLPSIRMLSNQLKLSRTTIEHAYGQLLLEGYVYSVQGVGYYANILAGKSHFTKKLDSSNKTISNQEAYSHIIYDLKNEYADSEAMDLKMWKKHINYVFANDSEALLKPLDMAGEPELRKRIANYIYMARGIEVGADEIIIGAGVQSLLNGLLPMIREDIQGLAVEDPGFKPVREVFERSGFEIGPIPLTDKGVDIDGLYQYQKHICYVSPAHQFPTGNVMQIENRVQLIQWAKDTQSYILEDDYNASLRYELFPVSSLKSLDVNDQVIYLGSFSTYLIPGIRISYIILPKSLRKASLSIGQTASKVEQLAFAHMLETGDYQRHINRIKKYYSKKTKSIHDLLDRYLDKGFLVQKNTSGLNVLIELPELGDNLTESILIDQLAKSGILISGVNEYVVCFQQKPMILLNYKGIPSDEMEAAIIMLTQILKTLTCS